MRCGGCEGPRPHHCRHGRALVGGRVECDCPNVECIKQQTAADRRAKGGHK